MIPIIVAVALAASLAQPSAARWSKIESSPDFRGWRQELQHVVDTEGHARTNHFCLVVQTFTPQRGPYDTKPPQEETIAYVLWREGHEVVEWGGSDPEGRILPVPGSGVLDLRTDIVPTTADLHGSTFRETRGWLRSIQQHCAQSGTQAVVMRRAH